MFWSSECDWSFQFSNHGEAKVGDRCWKPQGRQRVEMVCSFSRPFFNLCVCQVVPTFVRLAVRCCASANGAQNSATETDRSAWDRHTECQVVLGRVCPEAERAPFYSSLLLKVDSVLIQYILITVSPHPTPPSSSLLNLIPFSFSLEKNRLLRDNSQTG